MTRNKRTVLGLLVALAAPGCGGDDGHTEEQSAASSTGATSDETDDGTSDNTDDTDGVADTGIGDDTDGGATESGDDSGATGGSSSTGGGSTTGSGDAQIWDPCPNGDSDCAEELFCRTVEGGHFCTHGCSGSVFDCRKPAGANMFPSCEAPQFGSFSCVLPCADSAVCPAGMTCHHFANTNSGWCAWSG